MSAGEGGERFQMRIGDRIEALDDKVHDGRQARKKAWKLERNK
jgi:hypothetical protein